MKKLYKLSANLEGRLSYKGKHVEIDVVPIGGPRMISTLQAEHLQNGLFNYERTKLVPRTANAYILGFRDGGADLCAVQFYRMDDKYDPLRLIS